MKNLILTLLIMVALVATALAQAPQKFNYQAVARNTDGSLLANQDVGLRITIEDDNGTALYTETHALTTNAYGLFTLAIGGGNATSGTLAGINWGGGDRYVKVDIDPTGGNNYTNAGTSQLLSVPYALYAENSGNGGDTDPTNELQELSFNAATGELTLSNGNTITLPLATGGDNWGSQTVVSNNTLTGNGTTGSPLAVNGVLTDNQSLTLTGSNLAISGGNSVNLSGINTDAQTLSLTGNNLSISGGNSVTLPGSSGLPTAPNGATLRRSGSTWLADTTIFNDGAFVGIGITQPIGSARFVVSDPNTSAYGGMYVNTVITSGLPFYGYATGNTVRSWTYYDGTTQAWHYHDGVANRLTIRNGNVGIGTSDPTKRLHVNGTLRFATGTPSTGKVIKSIAADGSADWGTIGDAEIDDMERNFFIPASSFGEFTQSSNITVGGGGILIFSPGSFPLETANVLTSLPSDYVAGSLVRVDIYFTRSSNASGTVQFALGAESLGAGSTVNIQTSSFINGSVVNMTGPSNTMYKTTFSFTPTGSEVIYFNGLVRAAGTFPDDIYFFGARVRYTAKR